MRARAPRQRTRPPRLLQAFRRQLSAIPEELEPSPGPTNNGDAACTAAASAEPEQSTWATDSCSSCKERTPRYVDGPVWPDAPAGVLASVAQYRMTLRFKDADLERRFVNWHANEQRMVRAMLGFVPSNPLLCAAADDADSCILRLAC